MSRYLLLTDEDCVRFKNLFEEINSLDFNEIIRIEGENYNVKLKYNGNSNFIMNNNEKRRLQNIMKSRIINNCIEMKQIIIHQKFNFTFTIEILNIN